MRTREPDNTHRAEKKEAKTAGEEDVNRNEEEDDEEAAEVDKEELHELACRS